MGYIKHHTIVVTCWSEEKILEAYQKAKEIIQEEFSDEVFGRDTAIDMVSPIVPGVSNGQSSFFIAPDGSKEGWGPSHCGNRARDRFIEYLEEADYCDYVEVLFGGDDHHEGILRSRNKHLQEE